MLIKLSSTLADFNKGPVKSARIGKALEDWNRLMEVAKQAGAALRAKAEAKAQAEAEAERLQGLLSAKYSAQPMHGYPSKRAYLKAMREEKRAGLR